jgi:small GTP-binding protein
MIDDDFLKTCKVVLVGDSGVGKTCINNRFIENTFSPNVVPNSAASFATKNITFDEYGGKTVKFEIWDTAGQEQYRSIGKVFYKGAGGAVLIYEITNRKSFENIKSYWYNQIKEYSPKDINKFIFI